MVGYAVVVALVVSRSRLDSMIFRIFFNHNNSTFL